MAKESKSILINVKSVQNVLQDLTDEEAGMILKALIAYADSGEEFETDDRLLGLCFRTIRSEVDRNNEKYEDVCDKRRKAASERWKEKKVKKERSESHAVKDTSPMQDANASFALQTDANDSDNDNDEPKGSDSLSLREAKASLSKQSLDAAKARTREGGNPSRTEMSGKGQGPPKSETALSELADFWNCCIDEYNSVMPKIHSVQGKRKNAMLARCREYGTAAVEETVRKAAQSDFLNGRNARRWVASFDWLFLPSNFSKTFEGNFDNLPNSKQQQYGETTKIGQSASTMAKAERDADFAKYIAGKLGCGSVQGEIQDK